MQGQCHHYVDANWQNQFLGKLIDHDGYFVPQQPMRVESCVRLAQDDGINLPVETEPMSKS
jgi:hypothetical protein